MSYLLDYLIGYELSSLLCNLTVYTLLVRTLAECKEECALGPDPLRRSSSSFLGL